MAACMSAIQTKSTVHILRPFTYQHFSVVLHTSVVSIAISNDAIYDRNR